MAYRRPAPSRHPYAYEAQGRGNGHLGDDRRGQRTAHRKHSFLYNGHHGFFFLSLRTRSISSRSAPSSSSVHGASETRDVIICPSEPPKNVCKYCCSAVRL